MPTHDEDRAVSLAKTPPSAASPADPINVYAVISLVATLLGLFPIAIVFGILAFTRPAGRGIAIAGLVLGVLELAALLVALFGLSNAITDDTSDTDTAAATSVYEPFIPASEPPTLSATEPAPTETTSVPTPTDAPPATTNPPVLNETCSESQASVIATDANTGQNLVCTFLGADSGYKWVQSAEISPGTHEAGESCDPATDKVGRTPAGTPLICIGSVNGSGGQWSVGP